MQFDEQNKNASKLMLKTTALFQATPMIDSTENLSLVFVSGGSEHADAWTGLLVAEGAVCEGCVVELGAATSGGCDGNDDEEDGEDDDLIVG
jgi:hypothetical protein